MLNLASETDRSWVERAIGNLDEVLVDHAHCEKKAAGTAVNLIFRYPQHAFLHRPLSIPPGARRSMFWDRPV